MPSENTNKTQGGPNTSCIRHPQGLRRAPPYASDVGASETGEMYRPQLGKIHLIFSRGGCVSLTA